VEDLTALADMKQANPKANNLVGENMAHYGSLPPGRHAPSSPCGLRRAGPVFALAGYERISAHFLTE
jgi:hypothetical protein